MADNYLILDGKKYELSPELVNALRSIDPVPEKKSPFERKENEIFFYIEHNGFLRQTFDKSYVEDDEKYAVANYCTNKALMEQRAMHETLNRLLWRYSEEHGGDEPWASDGRWTPYYHYFIMMEFVSGKGIVSTNVNDSNKVQGVVYFKDKATAKAAIEEIVKPFLAAHPDFVW